MIRRRGSAMLLALATVIAVPDTAHADAAGPTDYRTEITSITPPAPSIELSVEGGDSFVRIVVDRGVEVLILGYDDEPYLLIDAAGDVFENARSFAAYYNDTRYGTSEVPAEVDSTAPPDWEQVGSGGAWAWHDHRAHWMARDAPVGMQPGDAFPAQTIPIVVDGRRIAVQVVTTLAAGPSWIPTALGALAGAVVTGVVLARRRALVAPAALGWSVIALGVGGAEYLSLPAETGPRTIWWVAPAVAAVCASLAIGRRRTTIVRDGLVAAAAVQLAVWVWVRHLTFTRPILPTDLPFWLDRAATAATLTGALGVCVMAVASVAALVRQAPRASSMAASSAS